MSLGAILTTRFSNVRPTIVSPTSQTKLKYAETSVRVGVLVRDSVSVTRLAPPIATHSFSMNQRLLVLEPHDLSEVAKSTYKVEVTAPGSAVLAPPGFLSTVCSLPRNSKPRYLRPEG
ncbi:hypothetical protein E2542_SST03989 [Spatholobus suberectus]|nr:hypothetical protein E2542_SST03989 [Spatholobus suberectus]